MKLKFHSFAYKKKKFPVFKEMYKKCQSKIPPHFFHTYQETIS